MSLQLSFISLLRWFAKGSMVLLIFLTVCGIAIYAAAKRFERQVGSLYTQTKSLKVERSTFEDVQKLAARYHYQHFGDQKECTPELCDWEIHLSNTPFPAIYDTPAMWRWGVRPTQAEAILEVRQGKLRYASFHLSTRTQCGYWLEGGFSAAPDLTMYDKCRIDYLGRDSAYVVQHSHLTNGDGNGEIIRTAFGVGATRDQVQQGTDIRIACITARPSCMTREDLMPEATKNFSFARVNDKQFTKECEDFMTKVEVGDGPWPLESAFYPQPISVGTWILTRSPDESWTPK